MRAALTLTIALVVPSCVLYTGGDDDPCDDYDYGGGADIAAYELRNPESGQCDDYTRYGGGGSCRAATDRETAAEPTPDWAVCYGDCESLDETTCLEAPACRGIYVGGCPEGAECDLPEEYVFAACWGTAPSGPVAGDCSGRDAYQCSQNDDCVARHFPSEGSGLREAPAIGNFDHCADEPTDAPAGCYDHSECGDGFYCNADEVCNPPPGCEGGGSTPDGGCPASECEPIDCQTCYGTCVPGTPPEAGSCYGEVDCLEEPPGCPPNSVAGRMDGCYTGFCIPVLDCEELPACGTLGESVCVGRSDCTPFYEGVGCSCEGDVCGCESWEFSECA